MKNLIVAIFISAFFYTLWLSGTHPEALTYLDKIYSYAEQGYNITASNLAAVLLHKPVTVAELKDKYNSPSTKKVRVLIVPGHEPGYGGAEYGSLKEREMNVLLSKYLGDFLRNNGHYDVMLARDDNNWNQTLLNYYITQWDDIIAFFKLNKEESLTDVGRTTSTGKPKVQHNNARTDVALRLYGINKWGNENAVDIAIHVHFNDYPRKNSGSPGVYSGFAVYVPESAYSNSTTTKAVAMTVFNRLAKYNPVSDLPLEDDGIIEEPDLIAIGAHNTSNAASMLIEYGYIYEPQFQNEATRTRTIRDMAFQTYLGLQDFFGSGNDVSFAYDTLMLPYSWNENLSMSKGKPEDVLALQTALLVDGFYPGPGKTKNDCPRTGKVGPCTLGALSAFQQRYGIKGEEGYVGEKTRLLLNGKYSVRTF